MLSFTEFKNEFIPDCRSLVAAIAADSMYKDIEIEERTVAKAQRGNLTGLIFRTPESVCAPTFYVEDYYEVYKDGRTPEELSVMLIQEACKYICDPPELPDIDPDNLTETGNFGVRLLNKGTNLEFLKDVPHLCKNGLALIAEIRSGEFRAVITNSLLESLDISKEELFDRALADSVSNDRATLYRISDIVCGSSESSENLLDAPGTDIPLPPSLYVLSNEDSFWGAAALFYPGMLSRLTKLMGGDFYVLPSSVHEVLLLPVTEGDPQQLSGIIRTANVTVVNSGDYLSDDLYLCESGKLKRVRSRLNE